MSSKIKRKIALLLVLIIAISSSINTTVLASDATNYSSLENQLLITNVQLSPAGGLSRMAKGYNYTYDLRNSGNNNELIAMYQALSYLI